MENRESENKVSALEAEIAALKELLAQQEKAASDQSARLEQTLVKLRQAQNNWWQTFDAMADMVFITSKDHRIVAANQATCEAFDGADVVGASCCEFLYGAGTPASGCPAEMVFRTGQPARAELSGEHSDSRWLDVRCFPIADEGASIEQALCVVTDITERKRTEEALKLFKNSADHSCNAIGVATPEGKHYYQNKAFDLLFGEVGTCPPETLYVDPEVGREVFERIMSGKPWQGEVKMYRKGDRAILDILLNAYALRNEDGRIIGLVGLHTDITERKRAAEALAESRRRLHAIFENAGDGILIADVEEKTFIECNPAICRMLGYTPEEIRKLSLSDIHPAKDLPYVAEQFAKQARAEITVAENLPVQRKDGSIFYADVSSAPLTLQGKPCLVGIFRDTTERREAERKLERYSLDLERANEEVKQFAYIVSHDLRGPLTNLKGFATEIRSSLKTLLPALETVLPNLTDVKEKAAIAEATEDIPESLDFMDASTTRMNDLIDALLKLSRMGRRELAFEMLDMNDIVGETLRGLAHQMEAHKATACVESLPEVEADRTAMEQIVANILTNAVNYFDPDRPGRIEIGSERTSEETIFSIRDNGRGISREDMPKVFAPFRRAGKQDVKGEGMGMAYVRALVRRHGGRIRCESELGVGTTFTFTIPHSAEQKKRSSATEKQDR